MKYKVKIESAHPQVRMLERRLGFAYEVWAWRVRYLLVPAERGCKNCNIRSGEIMLPLTGMTYSKAVLVKRLRKELEID